MMSKVKNSANQVERVSKSCHSLSISYHSVDKLIFALQSQLKSFYISGLSLISGVDKNLTYDS